ERSVLRRGTCSARIVCVSQPLCPSPRASERFRCLEQILCAFGTKPTGRGEVSVDARRTDSGRKSRQHVDNCIWSTIIHRSYYRITIQDIYSDCTATQFPTCGSRQADNIVSCCLQCRN